MVFLYNLRDIRIGRPRGGTLDEQTTIADLVALVRRFVSDRQWESFHDPKNLSASIAIEAAELMEIYQWQSGEQSLAASQDPQVRQETSEELADVLIYCLSLANALDIDISRAIREKMAINEHRFPADRCRGRLGHLPEDSTCPSS
jgi:NTP pyrophosphatase (non-canonical NTP hydrolase)